MFCNIVIRVLQVLWIDGLVEVTRFCHFKKQFPLFCVRILKKLVHRWIIPIFNFLLKQFHLSLDQSISYFTEWWKVLIVLYIHLPNQMLDGTSCLWCSMFSPIQAQPFDVCIMDKCHRTPPYHFIRVKRIMPPKPVGPYLFIVFGSLYIDLHLIIRNHYILF